MDWKACEFKIKTGEEGKVILNGYYPNEIDGNETGTIFIDGEPNAFTITENNFTIELSAKPKSIITIKIENNFELKDTGNDTRTLSFILYDVQGR